jgi:hypothetical protein
VEIDKGWHRRPSGQVGKGPVGIAAEEEVKIRQPWYIVGVWCFDTCSHLLQQCCCEDGVPPTYPDCLEEPG